jgi:hypothetical protein
MGRSNTWVYTTGIVIAVACGAKTDISDVGAIDTGPDAGAAAGQSGASGGTGRGGASGRGGANGIGGAAGRGGSFGASGSSGFGGTGAFAGGGGVAGGAGRGGTFGSGGTFGRGGAFGSAGDGGSAAVGPPREFEIEGIAAAVCGRIVPPPCSDNACFGPRGTPCTLEECEAKVIQEFKLALLEGCGDYYYEMTDCYLRTPDVCRVAAECLTTSTARLYNECYQNNNCIASTSVPGSCAVECYSPSWRADCQQAAGGMSCTCTQGRNGGTMFTIGMGCNSTAWNPTVAAFCR